MNSRSGFTLLELLVSLALVAIIGAGLATALRLSAQTYTRANELGEGADEISARVQLRHLLSRAASPSLSTPFPISFEGDNTSMSFVSLTNLGFAREAAGVKVTLSEEAGRLFATTTLFGEEGNSISSYQTTLAISVGRLSIAYFADGAWSETWPNASRLPNLVSITVEGQSEPIWPEFTVELVYAD